MEFCGFSLFKSCSKNKKKNQNSSKSENNELSNNHENHDSNEKIQNSSRLSINRNNTSDEHRNSTQNQDNDNRSKNATKKVCEKIAAVAKGSVNIKNDLHLPNTDENNRLGPDNTNNVDINQPSKHDEEIANIECEVDPLNAAEDIKQWLVKNECSNYLLSREGKLKIALYAKYPEIGMVS